MNRWDDVLHRMSQIEALLPADLQEPVLPDPADPARAALIRGAERRIRSFLAHWLVEAIGGRPAGVTPLEGWLIRQRLQFGEAWILGRIQAGEEPDPDMDTEALASWALLEQWHIEGATVWGKWQDEECSAG